MVASDRGTEPVPPIVVGTGSLTDGVLAALKGRTEGLVVVDDHSSWGTTDSACVLTFALTARRAEEMAKEAEAAVKMEKGRSGKCRHCGKWQSGLAHHEANACEKRFRR